MKEEMCATSRLSLAVNEEGQILSVNKDIGGGIPYFKLHDAIRVSHLYQPSPLVQGSIVPTYYCI